MSTAALPHANQPGSFTCISCQIQFPAPELQRIHMKTDWHRYNLKRRVAGLGAVSAALFQSKISSQERQDALNSNQDEFGFHIHHKNKSSGERQLTKKDLKKLTLRGRKLVDDVESDLERVGSPAGSVASRFSLGTVSSEFSSNYDTDDLRSELSKSDHDEYISTTDDDSEEYETEDSDEDRLSEDENDDVELELELTTCFYCGQHHSQIENNIRHMFTKHGLYLPERSFLMDTEGLLRYIADTISIDNECLKCGFIGKNLVSIRQHMQTKGHCVLPYETKSERESIREFYDFKLRTEDIETPKTKTKKSVSFSASTDNDTGGSDSTGRETEDDVQMDTTEEVDEEQEDSEYTTALIDRTGVELALPNGSRIGHRSMNRIYRQNFPRQERDIEDGERTLTVACTNTQELNASQIRERKLELKATGIQETRTRSKALNQKLKKCNHIENYRPQML